MIKKRMNKRAQGMSTSTIVLLILAVVVLVILILGFTIGWGKIAPWLSKSNVDNIATACEASCSTGAEYDFCSMPRDLKTADATLKDVTCNYLAEKQTIYGIDKCSSIVCEQILSDAATQEEAIADCASSGNLVQYFDGSALNTITCE